MKLASLEGTEEHVRVPTCSRAAERLWNVYIQGKQITQPRLISRNPRTRDVRRRRRKWKYKAH